MTQLTAQTVSRNYEEFTSSSRFHLRELGSRAFLLPSPSLPLSPSSFNVPLLFLGLGKETGSPRFREKSIHSTTVNSLSCASKYFQSRWRSLEDLHFFLPPAEKVDPLSIQNLDRTFSEVDYSPQNCPLLSPRTRKLQN